MPDTIDVRQALTAQLSTLFPFMQFRDLKRLNSARNSVYSAKAKDIDVILKFSPTVECDPLLREYQAICELYAHEGPVPRPLQMLSDRESQFQVNINDTNYTVRAYECIQGRTLTPSKHSFYSLGCSIGQLHGIWKTIYERDKPLWLPEVTVSDLLYKPLQAIEQLYTDHDKLIIITQLADTVANVLEAHQDRDLLGFSHGDAHHFNAIQSHDNQVILLDLEDSAWQWRAYDLATAIWGTFGRGGSAAIWNELIAGYTSICPLSEDEANLIRYLIFARHLWWLGLHARYWDRWPQRFTRVHFFDSGVDLLLMISKDVCGLEI